MLVISVESVIVISTLNVVRHVSVLHRIDKVEALFGLLGRYGTNASFCGELQLVMKV